MGDWLGYLELTAKAKTGVSGNVLIGAVVGAVAALATLIWLSITLFLWVSIRFDDTILAGLVLSAVFFVVALIAMAAVALARRRARQRAEAALAARRAAAALFDPSMLTVGLEIGRTIGWRRIAALAGVALLTSGLIKEWTVHKAPASDKPPPDEPPPAS
jgi:type VI protein secretion system component VasK